MKRLGKKLLCTLSALLLLATLPGIPCVYANNNTTLQIVSSQIMEIDETNQNQINFYSDESKTIKTGEVLVKLNNSPDYLTPVLSETGAVYDTGHDGSVYADVELLPNSSANFVAPNSYTFGNNETPLSSTYFHLTLTGGIQNQLCFSFGENNGGNPPGPGPDDGDMPGPMVEYPIIAQFEVPNQAPIAVSLSEEGAIVIPDSWTSGKVEFLARLYINGDGIGEPFDGQVGDGTIQDMPLEIEGIANAEELDGTVAGSADRKSVTISEVFSEYGKLQIHLVNELDSMAVVNQLLTVVHKKLISVKAEAPLSLSQSFGTVAANQAIITKNEEKDVKIFFGNAEAKLIAYGPTVDRITAVEGGTSCVLNADGSAIVYLPELSTETTTTVVMTIQKLDGNSIERTVNIKRTAIQLGHNYDRGNHAVYAGYVVNKGYLYNNQPHNDAIFNAYLQVVLYKNNAVAGYKQIKIDDGGLVNNLQNDESGSMELYGEQQIAIYGEAAGGIIDGVNKVSVFLTNGPIDFNGATLPSVEFGIGCGVTCEFGGATNE